MAFSDFRSLPDILKKFQLITREQAGLFRGCPGVQPSVELSVMLQRWTPLATAVGTEKARSEWIVAPILAELKMSAPQISLFSGVDLSVDAEAGLTGVCDFLLSRSPEQYFVTAPVVALVEAKNENLREGMGQCVAEMLAAQMFNQREGNPIPAVFGAVTNGTNWRFLGLSGRTLSIDMDEYLLGEVSQILGILLAMASGAATGL